ncbi:MAG: glucose-1-phosphate adenylyltransferase [bacterium]|nr:glucose-1-phosphate adenylyltransferase [bacterium]
MRSVLGIILGGGQGHRLYPLTKYRSKPAVPIAGKYRLIDVPVSNCIHSGIERIFVLTQFNSASLNRHINLTYKFDAFHEGFVDILAAEQTMDNMDWFQGTADAVRKSLRHLHRYNATDYLILAGDHIYTMDYSRMFAAHEAARADITIAVSPVTAQEASELGILQVDAQGQIVNFIEKPKPPTPLADFEIKDELRDKAALKDANKCLLGSMGVYLFKRDALNQVLENFEHTDFGRHIIPAAIQGKRVFAHVFSGYWQDVGTITTFFNSNMDLLTTRKDATFFAELARVFTRARYLPGSKIIGAEATSSMICEGCLIEPSKLINSLIGVRTIIQSGAHIENSFIMGADYYETDGDAPSEDRRGDPPIGIGPEASISGAIVDKNARIGRGVKILPKQPDENYPGLGFMVKDGITVIEKDAVIPDGVII